MQIQETCLPPGFRNCYLALRSAGRRVLSGRRAPWEAALNKCARALLILLIFAGSTGGLGKERQGSSSVLGNAGAFGFWKESFQVVGMSFCVSNKCTTLELALTLPDEHRQGFLPGFAQPSGPHVSLARRTQHVL